MTGEELHNFCKVLYSQIQSKDEEISRLTANIKELTDEVRLSRLQQQTYNDENKAVSASHSHKLDVVLQQLQETRQELTDTKRKLKTAETLLADAKEKNRQLEAEREKDAKERKDLENVNPMRDRRAGAAWSYDSNRDRKLLSDSNRRICNRGILGRTDKETDGVNR